jgi:hypothetical protein
VKLAVPVRAVRFEMESICTGLCTTTTPVPYICRANGGFFFFLPVPREQCDEATGRGPLLQDESGNRITTGPTAKQSAAGKGFAVAAASWLSLSAHHRPLSVALSQAQANQAAELQRHTQVPTMIDGASLSGDTTAMQRVIMLSIPSAAVRTR